MPPAQPSWDTLFDLASSQDGHFSVRQAKELNYSDQLLRHYVHKGRLSRVRRGIYRLVHYPPTDDEDLIVVWLWAERKGVFSHQTALSVHDLSDVLPARRHLTLPDAWRSRRLRVPAGVVLHHSDVPKADRTWFGTVPVTTPIRTLADCISAALSPELVEQAIDTGLSRGLFSNEMVRRVAPNWQPRKTRRGRRR